MIQKYIEVLEIDKFISDFSEFSYIYNYTLMTKSYKFELQKITSISQEE